MTLKGLNLCAGLIALATMGVVACADNSEPDMGLVPSVGTSSPTDAATVMPPPAPALPDAPPEIPASGPPEPADSTDLTVPPPGGPPPVLPPN
jgi:hypothetical protein